MVPDRETERRFGFDYRAVGRRLAKVQPTPRRSSKAPADRRGRQCLIEDAVEYELCRARCTFSGPCSSRTTMTARIHHYVPQWLQRRFLETETRLYYLDLSPERVRRPDGRFYTRRQLLHWGPQRCFSAVDLYSAQFPGQPMDVVERQFFGLIDDRAAKAAPCIVADEYAPKMEYYTHFLQYLSAQKMRTHKGLDWLRSFAGYAFSAPFDTPEALMSVLQHISEMHITTWTECHWEVLSAETADIGFLLSDHPVTAYNSRAFPGSRFCRYPLDPVIEMLGTRTIFALDSRHCLVLSNQEYLEEPSPQQAFRMRTNPRAFGTSLFSPLYINRGRCLSTEEVLQINFILKSRTKRYIAAPEGSWLYPEKALRRVHWPRFDNTLQPRNFTLRRGIWLTYSDGTEVAVDGLGRPITDSHEWEEMNRFKEHLRKTSG
jgi:uncharacterized protein DUF4238